MFLCLEAEGMGFDSRGEMFIFLSILRLSFSFLITGLREMEQVMPDANSGLA